MLLATDGEGDLQGWGRGGGRQRLMQRASQRSRAGWFSHRLGAAVLTAPALP